MGTAAAGQPVTVGHPGPPTGAGVDAGVDAVVVAFGAADLLDECLRVLGPSIPVTVVDNSSDPEVREVVGRHRGGYIDPGSNRGFAAGVNIGLAHRPGTGDVLLLNPDASITPDAVAELSHLLHSSDDLACVAPAQVDPDTGEAARVDWPFPTPAQAWLDALGLGRRLRRPTFLIGSILLIRAEALVDVGRFDEHFFLYAEETDWQRRAHELGWGTRLCPEVVATHVGAGTGGDRSEREIHFHASNERYVRKHDGPVGWAIFRAGVMAGAAVRALVLPGERGREAAARFRLYLHGPLRSEAERSGAERSGADRSGADRSGA